MEHLEEILEQQTEGDIERAARAEITAEAQAARTRVRSKITKFLVSGGELVREEHPVIGVIFSSRMRDGTVFTEGQLADHAAWRAGIARRAALAEERRMARIKARAEKEAEKAASFRKREANNASLRKRIHGR